MDTMTHDDIDHTTGQAEDVFRAWNTLEDALNHLVDLGEAPHLRAHVGTQVIRGDHGELFFSHNTERWVRRPRDRAHQL